MLISILSQILNQIDALGDIRNWLPTHYSFAWTGALVDPTRWDDMIRGGFASLAYAVLFAAPRVIAVDALRLAHKAGTVKAQNMVMLGALMANMDILPEGALERALKAHTAQRLQKFVEMNTRALARGAEYKAK